MAEERREQGGRLGSVTVQAVLIWLCKDCGQYEDHAAGILGSRGNCDRCGARTQLTMRVGRQLYVPLANLLN